MGLIEMKAVVLLNSVDKVREFVKITPKRKPIDKKFQNKKSGKPFHKNSGKRRKVNKNDN